MIPIIAARPDGLGTRLLTILFARQFADRLGAPLSVSWPSLNDSNYEDSAHLLKSSQVDEIFEQSRIFEDRDDIVFADEGGWSGKRVLFLHGMFETFQNKTCEEVTEICSSFDILVYDLPAQVCFQDNDRSIEDARIKQYWQCFNFARDVTTEFTALAGQAQLSEGVAVHVRRGDVVNMITQNDIAHLKVQGVTQIFQRYIPFKTVVNIVTECFPNAGSLTVCSEDREIVEKFQKALPGHSIVSGSGKFSSGGNKSALLDLMLLSQAKDLVTPFKSYFSDCASIVGRCVTHNAGLDIPNFIDEVTAIIDRRGGADKDARKAIFYTVGYQNLWHRPDDPYRADLLKLATAADVKIVEEILSGKFD